MAENLETIRRQVAIAGSVTDESSKQPIPRARVRLTNGPPAFVGPMVARAKLIPPRQAPNDVTQAYGDLDRTGVNNAGKLRAAQIVLDYQLRTGGAAFAVTAGSSAGACAGNSVAASISRKATLDMWA